MAVYELAAAVKQRIMLNDAAASDAAQGGHSARARRATADRSTVKVRYSPVAACCAFAVVALTACFGTRPQRAPPTPATAIPVPPAPEVAPPPSPDAVPDAIPRVEPRSRNGNPPFYDVFGKRYYVLSSSVGYIERGVASWYGPGFHKVRTSTGEPYDMYGMTAAHKTLPLPPMSRDESAERPQRRGPRQ